MRFSFIVRRALSGALVCATAVAAAQDAAYPKRGNVEITVLFPAGSSADVTARLLAQGMSRQLGTNVIVVNRPGAGGAIGYKYVAGQKPDGYSLVWNSNSISTTFHSGQLPFDYKSFDGVARVLVETPLLVVRGDARWKSLTDFIEDAKARPGKMSIANSGTGSHTHITAVALAKAAGIQVIDVPYAAAQVVPAVMGNHVEAMVQLPGAMAGQLKAGALRAIAALIPSRDPALPDVPTAQEQGLAVSLEAWRGIAVPAGTPRAVVGALDDAIRRTVETTEFAQGSERLYVRPSYLGNAQFNKLIAGEDVELARIMQSIGLKKD